MAHICAARVVAGAYPQALHLWDQPRELTERIIQSCAGYQGALADATNTSDWNIWDVHTHFPSALYGAPVLTVENHLINSIVGGFFDTFEAGVIKKLK